MNGPLSAEPLAGRPDAAGQQRRGRAAGEADALAREVRLVGVAGGEGEAREVAAARGQAQEPLEAQHAGERLGGIADGVREPAPQLALADAEAVAEGGHARVRPGEPER